MCVLAVAWQASPRWRLAVAANRDERHDRATAPLARWPDADVIAGRDLAAGGTWLGVSAAGRFAALTNLRGLGNDPSLASRGQLVRDLLVAPDAAMTAYAAGPARHNPFHAVTADAGGDAWLLSNHPAPGRRRLPAGIHAVSNGPLDAPWRKTQRLRRLLGDWLSDAQAPAERLLAVLRDPDPPPGSEEDPASLFVLDPDYGTRCSTIVLVDATGAGTIAERRFDPHGRIAGQTSLAFRWPCRSGQTADRGDQDFPPGWP